jgi:hypothetical protein
MHNPDSWSLVLDDLGYSVLFTLILKKECAKSNLTPSNVNDNSKNIRLNAVLLPNAYI